MRIHRVRLERFGCHKQLELRFEPGLNIIRGPNGAGKSTLQRALLKVLFDKPNSTKSNERECTWGEERMYRLALEFEVEGRGRCQLIKDFENNRCRLLLGADEALTRVAEVQAAIAQIIGTNSDRLFKSTLFVAQHELAELAAGKEIHSSLEERVTGGQAGVTTQSVLDAVKKKIDQYGKGYGPGARATTKPGLIVQTQREIQELDRQIADLRSRLEIKARWQNQRGKLEQQLSMRRQELRAAEDLLHQIERVSRLRDQIAEARQAEERLDRLLETLDQAGAELAAAEQRLATLKPVSDLSEERYRALLDLRNKRYLLQTEQQPSTPPARHPQVATALAVVGLVCAAAGSVLLTFEPMAGLAGLSLGLLVLLIGTLWWLFQAIRARSAEREAAVERQRSTVLAQVESQLQQALSDLGCDRWEEFEQRYNDVQTVRRERDRAQVQLKALIQANGEQEVLETERREASRKRRDGEEALDASELQAARNVSPIEHQRLIRQVEQSRAELEKLDREFHELSGRLAADSASKTDLLAAEERREALHHKLTRQQELLAVYQCIYDSLTRAREKMIERVRRELEERTCRHLARLTLGSLHKVAIDQDLKIVITMPGYDGWTASPSDLSSGQHDQLYFAVRLALIETLWSGDNLPLFLDDPFVTFDPARQQAAIQLCHGLGQTRQVFLFTCTDQYDPWGHVIELEPDWEQVSSASFQGVPE